jgi:hypothetical protein
MGNNVPPERWDKIIQYEIKKSIPFLTFRRQSISNFSLFFTPPKPVGFHLKGGTQNPSFTKRG